MAHLIYLICLSTYQKIGLKCTENRPQMYRQLYIWGRFSIHLRPIFYLSELSDWLRHITWQHKLTLPQMYSCLYIWGRFSIHLRPIFYLSELSDWLRHITWQHKLTLPQMYRSASNVQLSVHLRPIFCTFEADFLSVWAVWANQTPVHLRPIHWKCSNSLTFDSNSTSDRSAIRCAKTDPKTSPNNINIALISTR